MSESLKNISVGLLAYGAIGDEHSKAIRAVEGLRLTAVDSWLRFSTWLTSMS